MGPDALGEGGHEGVLRGEALAGKWGREASWGFPFRTGLNRAKEKKEQKKKKSNKWMGPGVRGQLLLREHLLQAARAGI